jgi:hypothetical protein
MLDYLYHTYRRVAEVPPPSPGQCVKFEDFFVKDFKNRVFPSFPNSRVHLLILFFCMSHSPRQLLGFLKTWGPTLGFLRAYTLLVSKTTISG